MEKSYSFATVHKRFRSEKKSILEGRDLGENVCKIWKTFCEYQIYDRQREAISLVLKYDFGAHKKVGNLFQHMPLNTLVV